MVARGRHQQPARTNPGYRPVLIQQPARTSPGYRPVVIQQSARTNPGYRPVVIQDTVRRGFRPASSPTVDRLLRVWSV